MLLPRLTLLSASLLAACASHPAGDGAPVQARSAAPAPSIPRIERPAGETAAWWFRAGAVAAHQRGAGREQARNLVLFVGDGMSLTTVAAARILAGQRGGAPGEEHRLAFEDFPHTALSRTYNTDRQVPDSAGTMTALVAGIKTRIGLMGVGQAATRGDCASAAGADVASLVELAEAAGLSTGIVTTARLTHATPGATYAHLPERNWEHDGDLSASARTAGCRDIARQFVEFDAGDGIEVALAGGRGQFFPTGTTDPEYPSQHGQRQDGRDLVQAWRARHPDGAYVWNAAQLSALGATPPRRLLGLFEPDHMRYEHERAADPGGEPSLAQMTRTALAMLARDTDGYVLVVESGRIDHANHAGNAFRALDETIAFSEAVRAAVEATDARDTLVLVTADHSHTMSFVGYPRRGNPILGKVIGASSEDHEPGLATDQLDLPYTTLGYANGPGYAGASAAQAEGPKRYPHNVAKVTPAGGRPDLRHVDTTDPDYLQEATYPLRSESHGGDDVGAWAQGPGASAVRGSIEQNVLFHVLLQSQPRLVALLCSLGRCEGGVPVKLTRPGELGAVRR
jgi:alkaline phosphatase